MNYELNPEYGGLRIKSLFDRSTLSGDTLIKSYQYIKNNSPYIPNYTSYPSSRYVYRKEGSPSSTLEDMSICTYYRYSTQEPNDNPYTDMNYFYYDKVLEYYGKNGGDNGMVEYNFAQSEKYNSDVLSIAALLVEKIVYQKSSSIAYQKINAEKFEYQSLIDPAFDYNTFGKPINPKEKRLWGALFMKLDDEVSVVVSALQTKCYPKLFGQLHFTISSFPEVLTKKITKEYVYTASTTDSIVQQEFYKYESLYHNKPTKIYSVDSRKDTSIQQFVYSRDYLNGNIYVDSLKKNNFLATPVESIYSIKKSTGSATILAGNLVEFNDRSIGIKNLFFKERIPVASTSFKYSNTAFGQQPFINPLSAYLPDSRYTIEKEVTQLLNGNITEVKNNNSGYTAYSWDNYNRLVAVVLNARSSDIAYSSFETPIKGNFNYSGTVTVDPTCPTGTAIYTLTSFPITKSGLNTTLNYIVSYWSKGGSVTVNGTVANEQYTLNGWTYYEHSISNPTSGLITISGTGYIDELRLRPKGSFMKTYVHQLLVGMIAQCDENNNISYFEYDGLGRLTIVRDEYRNVLKKICYNYSGQAENCTPGVNTTAQWRPNGQTRCPSCIANAAYISNIREREEKDINPASPTYNNSRWVVDPSGTCISPADWFPRTDLKYCEQDGSGTFTGRQITPTVDVNPCSPTYNQYGIPIITAGVVSCIPCTSCSSPQYKCINGVCSIGELKVVMTKKNGGLPATWTCFYAWCFPDGTYSNYSVQTTTTSTAFTIQCN